MSENYAISLKRSTALLAALSFMAMLTVVNFASFFSNKISAATLTERSLTLSSTLPGTEAVGAQGDPTNGADAIHTIKFKKSNTSVQSIWLQYCDDPLNTVCTAPDGDLDISNATITSSALGAITPGTTTANTVEFSFAANTATTEIDIVLTGVHNPHTLGTFFVRISTHSDNDPDGATDLVDDGNVASAITQGIEITARVKETLGFSTGLVDNNGVDAVGTACDPITTGNAITIGDPIENALALNDMYYNYTAFRTYTNAMHGMDITYEGDTLTSGTNDIDAATAAVAFAAGTEQFGLAVDGGAGTINNHPINSISAGSGDFTNVDTSTEFDGDAAGELGIEADYANGDQSTNIFKFVTGGPQVLASSTGYVDCVTVPVRYAANIGPLTAPGVYTTTIVYTAVPKY